MGEWFEDLMSATSMHGSGMTAPRIRDQLVDDIASKGIVNTQVLDALRSIPRHLFVDSAISTQAYKNQALPIGHGQTISQPYVVALMTQILLQEKPMQKVLEIGTGSGYQAAVLAETVDQVFTVERIIELSREARRLLRKLGYQNIRYKEADGYLGWEASAPFDGILLTAAPEAIPQCLFAQLREGGVLLAPVGSEGNQRMKRYRRQGMNIHIDDLGDASFVPMLEGKT